MLIGTHSTMLKDPKVQIRKPLRIFFNLLIFQRVLDMVMRKKREMADTENQLPPQIDSVLLLDRSVDLLTPLFTQLTYEGLIDEFYDIQNSK